MDFLAMSLRALLCPYFRDGDRKIVLKINNIIPKSVCNPYFRGVLSKYYHNL